MTAILQHESLVPLYIQLKDLLMGQIRAGVYGAGSKLPSERELAEIYNVSRMTARMALQSLGQEGVVTSRTGKGTFVSFSTIQQQLQRLTSFSQEMEQRGLKASSRVIRAEVVNAPGAIAAALGLSEKAPLALLERVRCADEQPLALETCYLNYSVCPAIFDKHDFAHESLYRVLQSQYGIRLLKAEQTIGARLPSDEEQHLLNIGMYDPVLSLVRTTYNELDQPIEHVISVYNGSAYQLRTRLNYDF